MTATVEVAVRRSTERLRPDPSRVIASLFVPGHEGFDQQDSRTGAVLARILAMDETEVQAAFDDVVARFDGRHPDLLGTFRRHASEVAERLASVPTLSDTRQLLLGATFTSEFALEGAAVCNPSIVAHPDQGGLAPGSLRFVMSFRAIGEGHRSSIGFRTGTIDAAGQPSIDPRSPFATTGTVTSVPVEAAAFRSDLLLDALGRRFTVAERTYGRRFSQATTVPERVLSPAMSAERAGVEDARFVRFAHEDGTVTYYATYTAYDGNAIGQQLLETPDFASFSSSPIVGAAAANKGLALFPRQIGGRFAALSRCDRETNTIAFSADPHVWTTSVPCQKPARAWEVLQLGNCGSPIETDSGWLVLTHGVGPMRTYSIGALLLDLDDPSRILGQLRHPLLSPAADEQNGYVPNVVYSCGALVHAGTLVLPYGIGDNAIGFATVAMSDLLSGLRTPTER